MEQEGFEYVFLNEPWKQTDIRHLDGMVGQALTSDQGSEHEHRPAGLSVSLLRAGKIMGADGKASFLLFLVFKTGSHLACAVLNSAV